MNLHVGERTELVDTGRYPRYRRPALGWLVLAGFVAVGSITGWFLWERGTLAADDAADARRSLEAANQRAAAAEDRILALSAAQWRAPTAAAPAVDLTALATALRGTMDEHAGEVAVDDSARRVVVTLDDPGLFRGDDAELTRRGEYVIDHLSAALVPIDDHTFWVHGHVDDAPLPDDALFETAWDLSAARALAVVQRLAAQGVDAHHLAAVAFGASRPRGQDRARNRRIELVIDASAPLPAAARAAASRSR